jgi:hypothetical protein
MTAAINKKDLNQRTQDFLSAVKYPNVHMSWDEWRKKARSWGLDKDEISELERYLETNNQLTSPVRFAGRQWWLTKKEIEHVEIIKQCFPDNWQTEVLDRMQTRLLGDIKKDFVLEQRKKNQR